MDGLIPPIAKLVAQEAAGRSTHYIVTVSHLIVAFCVLQKPEAVDRDRLLGHRPR